MPPEEADHQCLLQQPGERRHAIHHGRHATDACRGLQVREERVHQERDDRRRAHGKPGNEHAGPAHDAQAPEDQVERQADHQLQGESDRERHRGESRRERQDACRDGGRSGGREEPCGDVSRQDGLSHAAISSPFSRCISVPRALRRLRIVRHHDDRLAQLGVEPLEQAQDLLGASRGRGRRSARRPRCSVGSVMSARAIATRCCWPPESSFG